MYQVKVLEGCPKWLKKGQIVEMSNHRAETFARRGYVQILKYTGHGKLTLKTIDNNIAHAKKSILMWQEKLKKYQQLRKAAEKLLEETKNG